MYIYILCTYSCTEHPKPTKAVSSHQLTISLQSQPRCSAKNSDSIQPDQRDDRSEEGGGEIDNDLSVPTPESAGARTLSEPVFLQRTSTNYMLTPGKRLYYCVDNISTPHTNQGKATEVSQPDKPVN